MAIVLNDNEFFTGLTNLALFIRLYATNTSEMVGGFIKSFSTDTLANGDRKLFPYSDLPEVQDYSETSSLLTVTKVDTGEEEIVISEKKVIPSSYSSRILSMAFTSESGMNEFIGYILGQMESARDKYIFEGTITDLYAKTFSGDMQNKDVDFYNLSDISTLTELNSGQLVNNKNLAMAMQMITRNMQIYSDKYNSLGLQSAVKLSDLKFVFAEPYHSDNLMNLYATLLKSDVIKDSFDMPKMITIPELAIPTTPATNPNVIGWVMHKYAYQWFYKFVFMGSFFDMSNLVINNFLHFWYGKGWVDFLPVAKLTKKNVALGGGG